MQTGSNKSSTEAKSTLVSKNININGRRTSIRLEPEMWTALHEIAARENCTMHDICGLVHARKSENTSLTAAIRVFIMLYFRAACTERGHEKAGHGNFEYMRARARMKTARPTNNNKILNKQMPRNMDFQGNISASGAL